MENKKPKIRFSGFSEDWKRKELSEIIEVCSGKDYKHLSNGEIPVFGTGGYMLSVDKALSYDKDAIGIGRKGTIDKPYILIAPFWTVDTLFYSLPKNSNDINFIYDIFQNINWKQKDESTGVPSLSKIAINQTQTYITKTSEQTKIGNLFKEIDSLIALRQQKYEKLQNMKKALLEKMFPKKDHKTPEIRFNGFSDEWVEKGFKQVATYKNGKAHENNIVDNGGYIVINSKFVSTNGEVKKFTDIQIEPLRKNDIAFVLSDVPNGKAIAKTYLVDEDGKYSLNQRIAGITSLEDINSYFLQLTLNRNKYFLLFDDGVKQTNLSVNDIYEFSSKYPQLPEQTKIGKLFKNLDDLITLYSEEIGKLQNIKKALLDKMFI